MESSFQCAKSTTKGFNKSVNSFQMGFILPAYWTARAIKVLRLVLATIIVGVIMHNSHFSSKRNAVFFCNSTKKFNSECFSPMALSSSVDQTLKMTFCPRIFWRNPSIFRHLTHECSFFGEFNEKKLPNGRTFWKASSLQTSTHYTCVQDPCPPRSGDMVHKSADVCMEQL